VRQRGLSTDPVLQPPPPLPPQQQRCGMALSADCCSLQEPSKAIEAYEAALHRKPRDGVLASKIGTRLASRTSSR
jgi:hypothetical protein